MTTKVHIVNTGPNDVSVYTTHSIPGDQEHGRANSSDQRVVPGQHVELYVDRHSEQNIRVAELPGN